MTLSECTDNLLSTLRTMGLPEEEYAYRKNDLLQANDGCTYFCNLGPRYYNLAHEIKSMAFLQQFGIVSPSFDSKHTPGCDAKLNNQYQIEFVCTSPGTKTDKSGFDRFSIRNMKGSMFGDYSEKERFLFSRITSVLHEKRRFYEHHLTQNTISPNKPYLIFLGLGSLAEEMFAGNYGIALTGVLLGKGCPTITINSSGNVIARGYSHNENFPKYSGVPIDCNLFCRDEFRCVSAVIFSDASLGEDYTTKNTWLFMNPFANNKVIKKDFHGMVYWSANSNWDYLPRCRGKRI